MVGWNLGDADSVESEQREFFQGLQRNWEFATNRTENGGLVFGGHRNANGEVVDAGVALSFDRYGASSQFVQLAGVQDSKNHIVGLTLSETEPTGNRRRLFIGHDKEGVASVSLMDRNGRKRIVLQVTSDGTPSISFLDADGKVVNQLGPTRSQ